jgi:hypothetical protein
MKLRPAKPALEHDPESVYRCKTERVTIQRKVITL